MPGKLARKWQFARESRRPLAYGSIRRDGKDESMDWRAPETEPTVLGYWIWQIGRG